MSTPKIRDFEVGRWLPPKFGISEVVRWLPPKSGISGIRAGELSRVEVFYNFQNSLVLQGTPRENDRVPKRSLPQNCKNHTVSSNGLIRFAGEGSSKQGRKAMESCKVEQKEASKIL